MAESVDPRTNSEPPTRAGRDRAAHGEEGRGPYGGAFVWRVTGMLAPLVLFATPASADVPWTWGLATGLTQWWVIALGLAIEWPVIRYITRRGWWRSLWATLVVNLVSALIGALALWIPLALPLSYLEHWWGPAGIAAGVIVVVAMDAAVEGGVLIGAFRATLGRRGWIALVLVNLVSVSAVFVGWGWETYWNRRTYVRDWRQLETLGGSAASVVAGDLNGDAHPDLVVAHPDSGVVVHYGLGKGEFGPPTPAPDSLLDRMWRDEAGVRPLRLILDPDSRWSSPRGLRVPSPRSESDRYFLAGDIDGDGRADAIRLDADGRTSTLRLGDGGGEFGTPIPIPFREWLLDAECVDFDGHGRRELLLLTSPPGNGKNTLRILSLTGQELREQGRMPVPGDAQQIVTADLDGDGRKELLLNESSREGCIAVFDRGRNVSFRHRADIRAPVEIACLSSADLNEDHLDDLIIGGYHEVAFRCTRHGGR